MSKPKRALTSVLLSASAAWAQPLGEVDLTLWQISYTAPTRYADGYTVRGKANSFQGAFHFDDGRLHSLQGTVPIMSLNSGLASRDASIRELLFSTSDGRLPDLAFQAQPSDCTPSGQAWSCQVSGSFRIRDEWQTVQVAVYIGTYQGRQWLHAEGQARLSQYRFYATSSEALKVADEVTVVIDLLGPQA